MWTSTYKALEVILSLFLLFTFLNAQELLFRVGNKTLHDGDSVDITDIGSQPSDRREPGNTLVCDTINVNVKCCRGRDTGNGSLGNWYLPTGVPVIFGHSVGIMKNIFARIGYIQQIRLASIGSPIGPLGIYICRVPVNGTEVNGSIILTGTLSISSLSVSPPNPVVMAGETLPLTCTATTTGRGGTPSFTWTGQVTRGPQLGQAVQESTNMFKDTLTILKVSQINPNIQCMASTKNSTLHTSVILSVKVPKFNASISESRSPIVGQNYRLVCDVTILPTLMTVVSYSWLMDETVLARQSTNQLDLSPLSLSRNGTRYTCQCSISSPYFNSTITGVSATYEVAIYVTISSVIISPSNPIGVASESDVTFTCTALLSGPAIPIITWSGPVENIPTQPSVPVETFSNSLVLAPVRQSYAGTYTCTVFVGASSMSSLPAMLTVTAPSIPIDITESEFPVALRNYSLICAVLPPLSLAVTSPSYYWSKNGRVLTDHTNTELNLSPLQTTENGVQYTCRYRASSIFVHNVDISTTHTIVLTFAPPSSPSNVRGITNLTSVMLTWAQSELDIVDHYILSYTRTAGCSEAPSGSKLVQGTLREYSISGLEENTTYDINILAVNAINTSLSATISFTTLTSEPTGTVEEVMSSQVNYTSMVISWQPVDCLQQNSPISSYIVRYTEGNVTTGPWSTTDTLFVAHSLFPGTSYSFHIAAVNQNGTGPYIPYRVSTLHPAGLFLLKDQNFINNSMVTITDIGQNSEALFCFTIENRCCRSEDNSPVGTRSWFFPDGDVIGNKMVNTTYISRGPQTVILHRDYNIKMQSGIYRCQIYAEEVYIGLYYMNEGLLVLHSISYNTTTGVVTCISTGGPVTNLTWNRIGESYQQSKIIVNTVTATYHNLLYISGNVLSNYIGIFICTISNSRGSVSRTTAEFKAIELAGNKSVYDVGSTASVICFSNLTVVSMRWFIESSQVSFSINQTRDNEIHLKISGGISEDTHGTIFTCEVVNRLPIGITETSSAVFVIRTSQKANMTTIPPTLSSAFNAVTVVVIVIIGFILTILTSGSFIVIVYYINSSRKNSIKTNVNSTSSEYEEIGNYKEKICLKNQGLNLDYEEIRNCDENAYKPTNSSMNNLEA